MPEKRCLLDIKGISKQFSGVTVFSDFDFKVYEGEVHCLCGENGAGKSTFIKILAGAHQRDSGEISINGNSLHGKLNPALCMKLGIQTIYQEHTLMQNMSIMENLFIGKEVTNKIILDRKRMYKETLDVLAKIGVTGLDPKMPVRMLGTAQQKFVEIAKAFVHEAKIIIMDEPTASFGSHEIEQLMGVITSLKEKGVGIIYISHHLEEVFRIADKVTVIRDGRKIRTYSREQIDEASIIRDMVGRDASMFYSREAAEIGDPVMEVRKLSGKGVRDISFTLRRGEILGFAGLVGAGRTEMAELLFGRKIPEAGEINIEGQTVRFKTPRDAIKAGLCMITEDRQLTGLFTKQKNSLNTVLAHSAKYPVGFMHPDYDKETCCEYISKLNIKCKGPEQQVRFLSGGNQQKIILSKWFHSNGNIYIFDEPTRGVDIGAKEEIYKVMVELCKQGKSIIMISSDMPEVIAMSDRVMVMKDGGILAELSKEDADSETILSYALGGCKA
ncbi:ribose transport system ATP-binding protein [Ruminiclostridium sufflavum DSM 19573]|uniref:Ribose transport system ATP-binding protein n=1 Tax=Ruminiclostridium sufflavum DSM 19573 TaxID=1121337 RepID=A0A318Y478_9FIRM|nr:sugar ABC transporter ATP-binding protein [Ruminiclostridium sufflavum]PYG90388.1 ribose transport system ATP-binding protein [Ruminiclostridium sufflavum DSM 19573]